METYLETRTSETDENCRGDCGYAAHQEIHTNEITGLRYWVQTQFFPMSKDDRKVARPDGPHHWNKEEFPSVHQPVETVLVLRYLNADPITGGYAMIVDAGGNKTVPPIEWELALLPLSATDKVHLKALPDIGTDWHHADFALTLNEDDGQKEFYRVNAQARWTKNPDLVKDVEAERQRSDFQPKPFVPEKGRAVRFAILKPKVGEEIEEVF